jgi:hypothetical protein
VREAVANAILTSNVDGLDVVIKVSDLMLCSLLISLSCHHSHQIIVPETCFCVAECRSSRDLHTAKFGARSSAGLKSVLLPTLWLSTILNNLVLSKLGLTMLNNIVDNYEHYYTFNIYSRS